mmetsp:Transcript_34389/g.98262  ORF Transcript_34389/g.98262 Transcript_34389/m.98262 type:complete len:294 (+) Transcript_34389:87-968(+)
MFSSLQSFGSETLTMGPPASAATWVPPAAPPDAGARKPKQEDKQTCLPVTVRAIEHAVEQRADSGGEALRFFGAEAGMLVLVGMVEGLVKQSASLEFSLNDATGRIKARHYVTDRQQDQGLDDLASGRYVCAFGNVRTAPQLHFAVTGMHLVKSADEVSFHAVEAAHAALRLLRGRSEPTTPAPQKGRAAVGSGTAPMDLSPVKTERSAAESPAAAAAPDAASKPASSGKDLKKAIFSFLKKEGEDRAEGLAFGAVCEHVGQASSADVTAALKRLVDDGEVFTTIDDWHFSCV